MNVVLINPYLFDSLSLRTLHTVLRHHGFKTTSIFFKNLLLNKEFLPSRQEWQILLDCVKKLRPDVIGISIRSTYASLTYEMAVSLKKETKSWVILGGTHVTLSPREALKHADAVCVGEGEHSFLEALNQLKSGSYPLSVRGIWTRGAGKVIDNGYAVVDDLNSLPFDWFDNERLYIENNRMASRVKDVVRVMDRYAATLNSFMDGYSTMASRGCPFRCSFCLNGVLGRDKSGLVTVRRRSVENIVAEIQQAHDRLHFHSVYFEDDIFPFDKTWLGEFSERYKRECGVPFMVNSHFSCLSEELLDKMHDAGLRVIKIGIQSGSDRINNIYGRQLFKERAISLANSIRKLNLTAYYDVIINNPLETDSDKQDTLKFLTRLPKPYSLIMHPLFLFPKYVISDYFHNLLKDNVVAKSAHETMQNWYFRFNQNEAPSDAFWNSLFWLASLFWVPRRVLLRIAESRFFRKYAYFLRFIVFVLYVVFKNYIFEKVYIRRVWLCRGNKER